MCFISVYCLISQWRHVKSLSSGCVCRSRCLRMWTWALQSFVSVPLTLTLASSLLLNTAWWMGKASLPSNHLLWVHTHTHTHIHSLHYTFSALGVNTELHPVRTLTFKQTFLVGWWWRKHWLAFLSHPVINALVSQKQPWPHSTLLLPSLSLAPLWVRGRSTSCHLWTERQKITTLWLPLPVTTLAAVPITDERTLFRYDDVDRLNL